MVCDSCHDVVERVWITRHYSLYCGACITAALWVWRLRSEHPDEPVQ